MFVGARIRARGGAAMTAVALTAFLAVGCAASPAAVGVGTAAPAAAASAAASVIAPPSAGATTVPDPTGAAVLTVTGLVGATNAGAALRFDAAGLDRLGLLKVEVFEPWVKKDLSYQGTWLTDLLGVARPGPTASSVHITALDDYQVDLTMADIAAGGIFLATKRGDGTPIPVEEGGPTRIIFVGGVASGASRDRWIWSLTTIDIR